MPVIAAQGLAVDVIDRGSGEVALLLHSAGMGAGQWRGVIAALAGRFRLIAPNLRGYARSTPWPADRMADFAEELVSLRIVLDTLPGPVHLVGHSFGACLALHLAVADPQRFRTLTLIEPVTLGILRSEGEDQVLAEVEAMIRNCVAAFEAGNVNAAMTHFVDYWYGPGYWEAIPKAQRLLIYARAKKMFQEVRAVRADNVPLAHYAGIALPSLVAIGAETTPAARRMSRLLAGVLEDAVYEEIAGSGHLLPLTHHEVLAERIARHFDDARATPDSD